ncbi:MULTISPECIES: glycine oxidase ThiO [unclassified Ensifer]|uniref:glycine oxidase ThiO n=1 Tax=unclassified Ensifer TaxID=2633371 RepID=UPI000813376A|nr:MULTISPECIES: glycine oxidase ThiO [unclassified Ensifer]OCP24874.1 glycine oxidase ThiO [Ensifer sp. LC54]OCP25988.1 glycine oxidase ThiO [Ensifer sp. LC384]
MRPVLIKGAGVVGLVTAYELARRGIDVDVVEQAQHIGAGASWFAGGMLAPWCERESADERVERVGATAIEWWKAALPGKVAQEGTLVVAAARDTRELDRFATRTTGHRWLDAEEIAELEPDLAGRFARALYFPREAHLDPREALSSLRDTLMAMGVRFHFGQTTDATVSHRFDWRIDCTGRARLPDDAALRGVRGEMLYLRTGDIQLSRPVRFLHPRHPLYVVPRRQGLFMVGATMIESETCGPIAARSLMELLNAAYALHPAFGEAEITETGTGVRPAYPDNLPRITRSGSTFCVNGLYRHGFLLSPALAHDVAECLLNPNHQSEFHDES